MPDTTFRTPAEHAAEKQLHDELEDTFPASDPPSVMRRSIDRPEPLPPPEPRAAKTNTSAAPSDGSRLSTGDVFAFISLVAFALLGSRLARRS